MHRYRVLRHGKGRAAAKRSGDRQDEAKKQASHASLPNEAKALIRWPEPYHGGNAVDPLGSAVFSPANLVAGLDSRGAKV